MLGCQTSVAGEQATVKRKRRDNHRESGDILSHRLKRMNGEDYARYQLIARATYLRLLLRLR